MELADNFALAADGSELYQLIFPHEINRYVYVFGSDGTFKSAVKLPPGFVFAPSKLAVVPGGQYLISGLKYDTVKTAAMWPFTGIFATNGRLLKELELEDDKALHDMVASGDARLTSSGNPRGNRAISNGRCKLVQTGMPILCAGPIRRFFM